jgi:hypothetical protein
MRFTFGSVGALAGAALLIGSTAQAAPIVYFGENQTPANTVTGAPVTARNNFLGSLVGVGTEQFEGPSVGTGAPLAVNFQGSSSGITANLTGSGGINNNTSAGRFNTSPGGSKWWEVSGAFQMDFSSPIAAFGFYGTDIGDFNGNVTVALRNAATNAVTNLVINNTLNGRNGSLLFWGFVDPTTTYNRITFGNTNAGVDFFGFDSMTIGDQQQVNVPEPVTISLLGLGLLAAARRRRRTA